MGVVVVTGGSRGIGAATCRRAAAAGWDVVLSYVRDADAAASVVTSCTSYGVQAVAVRADVSVEADVVALFDAAGEVGVLSGLVNNAGIVAQQSLVRDMDAERITRMFSVNVVGAFLCAREAVRRMPQGGSIVNVGSRASTIGSAGEYVDYAASKGAIDTMTLGLSREVAGDGIRVNCVRPGIVDTEIHASGGDPGRAARVGSGAPLGRPGTADEVAAAIVWLLSDEASYTTGALLDVSGGR